MLLARTFRKLGAGGPVPPLGLLYLASAVRERFADGLAVSVIDLGCAGEDGAVEQVRSLRPDYIGLSAMSCEAGSLHEVAGRFKEASVHSRIIVGGPHATAVGPLLLSDENIEFVVIGEGERTLVELLERLEGDADPGSVDGIAFRVAEGVTTTATRELIADLDELPSPAWDLVELAAYDGQPNWSGLLREKSYAPILTSRGCPFGCTYCFRMFGREVRLRSPGSVVGEMDRLNRELGVREFHILDDVFNVDPERVRGICELLIEAGSPYSLAFPTGMRADLLDRELAGLLRRAGAYRIHFGIETSSVELQARLGKNLDPVEAMATIDLVGREGITTAGYFMFGLPGQSREQMLETAEFAADSRLDLAFFFKATPYPGSELYRDLHGGATDYSPESFADHHFFSTERSCGDLEPDQLNQVILRAQQMFYSRPARLWRAFRKAPRKLQWLRALLELFATLLLAVVARSLATPGREASRP